MNTFLVIQNSSDSWALIFAPDSAKAMGVFDTHYPVNPASSAWPIDDGQVEARLNSLKDRQSNFLGHFTYKVPAFYRDDDDDRRDICKANGALFLTCANVEDTEFVLQALLAYKET